MVQKARPISDVTNVGWSNQAAATTNLFQSVNETTPSDGSFNITGTTPLGSVLVHKLSVTTDPGTTASHALRWRQSKNLADGEQINHLFGLYQGYTNEGAKGTLIAQQLQANLSATTFTSTLTLTAAEVTSITSRGNLYVRSEMSQVVPFIGNTFFLADAESGIVKPPWTGPNPFANGSNSSVPVCSTVQKKNGTRSYKFEVGAHTAAAASSTVMVENPQTSMGGSGNGFRSGFYSFWCYVDIGFNNTAWNFILGWMTGSGPSPINYIGIENWGNNGANRRTVAQGGSLQMIFLMKNSGPTTYTAPTIAGYDNTNGAEWYRMTSTSPAGIVTFPRQQWVHICVGYTMAAFPDGAVTIWQDGVMIFDLAGFDTLRGHAAAGPDPIYTNSAGDMTLQHFIYGSAEAETRRIYTDDFKVTDFRVTP